MLASDPRDLAERLLWVSDALHAAAAISAAHRTGVLAMLEAGAVRPKDVAAQCQLDVNGVVVLLEALAAMGLVDSAVDGQLASPFPACARSLPAVIAAICSPTPSAPVARRWSATSRPELRTSTRTQ